MKNLEDLTGYDKVAIIFDILGDSLSINMFKDIPEAEFYKIRDHAKHLRNDVPTSVKKEVLEDYYFKMLSNEKYKDQTNDEEMFDFLNGLDDEQLYTLLSPEKPRVIPRWRIFSRRFSFGILFKIERKNRIFPKGPHDQDQVHGQSCLNQIHILRFFL